MYRFALVLVVAAASLASAGRSPNAGKVEEYLKSYKGERFSDNIIEDAFMDVPELVQKYGYPFEAHNVITSDGYIVQMHRIPHGRDAHNQPGSRKVIFLMHGMFSSSADYLILGPGSALGYLLAENGYDVWLGNARGNYYSRRHITLDPDNNNNQDFWKFSWDQIGNLDLPACIDYILAMTGVEKMHYVGHSQGGTSFFVLNSLRPEYNEKFTSFQGFAPASFFDYNANFIFNILAPHGSLIETLLFAAGFGEVLKNTEALTDLGFRVCGDEAPLQPLCFSLLAQGGDMQNFNMTKIPLFLGHAPAGGSIRQVAHYGQSIKNRTFRRYDHGLLGNLAAYGTRTPPDYDMSKVTVPAYIHYGLGDTLVDYRDIYVLGRSLGNLQGLYQNPRATFGHVDFIWGIDSKPLYDGLFEHLTDAENIVRN